MSWFSIRDDWPTAPPITPAVTRNRQSSNSCGVWTDERIEALKKLWADGLSCTQVAVELGNGITRNAVIGKVHRLGLSGRTKPAAAGPHLRPPRKAAIRPELRPPQRKAPQPFSFKKGPPMMPVPFSPAPAMVTPICEPVTIMGLNEHTCRFPISDDPRQTPIEEFMYCGASTQFGESYCPFHFQLAYTGVPPRKFSQARPR